MSNPEFTQEQQEDNERKPKLPVSLLDRLIAEAVSYYPDKDMVLED
jgi:hypothetical protein